MQDTIFAQSEADQWFLRNKDCILQKKPENDICTQQIKQVLDCNNIHSVLELGASNGYRLNFLRTLLPNCKTFVGMDASALAVEDGKKRYNLHLIRDTLVNFKLNQKFDLVIVNFVLHWIDRENLFQCIANIDKFLSEGGILVLGDFSPRYPYRRIYKHYTKEPVYTYKTNYENVFLSLNTYTLINKKVFNHDNVSQAANNSNSACIAILKKDSNNYYAEE